MKTAALLAGMIVLLCGCAAKPPPNVAAGPSPPNAVAAAPPSASSTAQNTCIGDLTGQQFVLDRVKWLPSRAFNFDTNGGSDQGHYQAPKYVDFGGSIANYDTYNRELALAFQIAPSWLQSRLCDPKIYVLIDQNDSASASKPMGWSFWEVQGQDSGKGRYVGLSESLLRSPPALQDYETRIGLALLGARAGKVFHGVVANGEANNGEMTMLAVLAHEIGHLRLADEDPSQWRDCRFYDLSWKTHGAPFKGIHFFPKHVPPNLVTGDDPIWVGVRDVAIALVSKHYVIALAKMKQIFARGGRDLAWANLFASTASDNDFAQTYAYLALAKAKAVPLGNSLTSGPLTSLLIELNTHPIVALNMISNLSDTSTTLNKKAQCLARHL